MKKNGFLYLLKPNIILNVINSANADKKSVGLMHSITDNLVIYFAGLLQYIYSFLIYYT